MKGSRGIWGLYETYGDVGISQDWDIGGHIEMYGFPKIGM